MAKFRCWRSQVWGFMGYHCAATRSKARWQVIAGLLDVGWIRRKDIGCMLGKIQIKREPTCDLVPTAAYGIHGMSAEIMHQILAKDSPTCAFCGRRHRGGECRGCL